MDFSSPLIRIQALSRTYENRTAFSFTSGQTIPALRDVSLEVFAGEILGIIGESGSGKSTLGRCLLRLEQPDSGSVIWAGREVTRLPDKKLRPLRRRMQMIFQNSGQALNPLHSVEHTLLEPLTVIMKQPRRAAQRRVDALLEMVGLDINLRRRYPGQLSGGQRQRVAIARALALEPALVVADEPTASLDAANKKQILDLLKILKEQLNLTVIIISHEVPAIAYCADRIAVMYRGSLVELASTRHLLERARHPYTRFLLSHGQPGEQDQARVRPAVASARQEHGCPYFDNCPLAANRCRENKPVVGEVGRDHLVACEKAA